MVAERSHLSENGYRVVVPPPNFDHRSFDPVGLCSLKRGRRVSVCLPARDEAATIGNIVSSIRTALVDRVGLVDEILVIDDDSSDETAVRAEAAGARVVEGGTVLPAFGARGGKGQAMWRGVFESVGDFVVFLDADVRNFGPHFVTGLLGPLLHHDETCMVKAYYERPNHGRSGQGGRVTELVAKPLISMLFPHLAFVRQPLAGECAARRQVLERVGFAPGYGVELALLVDVASAFGAGSIAQVDLGVREHRNRPLEELAPQARTIMETAFRRAGVDGTGLGGPTQSTPADLPPLVDVPAYRRRSA